MTRSWALFFCCFAAILQAQQVMMPIDKCLEANPIIDAQILACDAALKSSEATDSELVYLPPIIAELRGEVGDFEVAGADANLTGTGGAELLLAMGEAQLQAGRYALAMNFFLIAKTNFVDSEIALRGMKDFLADIAMIFEDDLPNFIPILNKGLEHRPFDPELLVARAEVFARLGDMERAFVDWDRAIDEALYPHLIQFQRAEFLWELKLADEALADLSVLAEELMAGGRHEALIRSRREIVTGYYRSSNAQLLESLPDFRRDVLKLITDIHRDTGDNDAALIASEAWINHMPTDVLGLSAKGEVLASMGRHSDALRAFDILVVQAQLNDDNEIGSDSIIAFWTRGLFHASDRNVDLAMTDFNRVFGELEPDRIARIQRILKQLGVFQGEIDGNYDEGTKQALAQCIREPSCDLG